MFESILEFSYSVYQAMQNVSQTLIEFFMKSLNDITGLNSGLAIMDMNLVTLLLGGGLISFLTFKIVKFVSGL